MHCYEFPPIGGGGSRVVDGLSRDLVRAGHDVDVVTTRFRGSPRRETIDGVNVHRVDCIRIKQHLCTLPEAATYLFASMSKILELVGRRSYDLNHCHFILPDGFNARRLKEATGLPYIVTAHGSDVPGYNPHRVRVMHRLLEPLWRSIAREASAVVCPSRSLQALVGKADPELDTVLIPYGFDISRYRAEEPRAKRILVVTRMLRRKGVQYLLHAMRGLPLQHELHLVGDGPYLPVLRRLARGIRVPVIFHGWLDNRSEKLTRLFESSDIFVLPSERENFPVALMEAMAAGLAIVTTRGTGCSEVVGEAGILIEPHDTAGLQAALESLVDDPIRARKLGQAARARLENEFSWPAVTDRYLDLYARCQLAPTARVSVTPAVK